MKLGKLLVVLALLVVGLIVYSKYGKQASDNQSPTAQQNDQQGDADEDKPRLEEKLGITITSETALP